MDNILINEFNIIFIMEYTFKKLSRLKMLNDSMTINPSRYNTNGISFFAFFIKYGKIQY